MTASRRRYDPFAPAAPGFPERRLRRAGLTDDALAEVRGDYERMNARQRTELARFVTRNPDPVLRERFMESMSLDEAMELTVDELEARLRERPGGLSTRGRKAELAQRLVDSYSRQAPSGPPPAPEDGPALAEVSPDAAEGAQEAQDGQPGIVQTEDGAQHVGVVPADAAAPPQTPDAAPAPATPTEETPRV